MRFASAAVLSFGSAVYAQSLATFCPSTNLCYSLNIPDSTAKSGNGDIFFQISAPTSYEWVALGQGSQMAGSNIFIMYTSADGQNVTVSPRLGTGNVEPEHNAQAQITLLEGSGVSSGMMTANVRCGSCNTWSGGSMDFNSSSANWIYASRPGASLNTDDVSVGLLKHEDNAPFTWDMQNAKGGSSVNPFVSSAATGNTNATAGGTNSTFDSNAPFGGNAALGSRIQTAHGVLASIAFVAIFPTGGIIVRVAKFTGLTWIHAAVQIFGYAIFIAAFGMGIYLAKELDYLSEYHPIIGIVLFGILFFQPFSGFLHHRLFKKHAGRTLWSYEHLGIGRIAIILGIVNGGLGIHLAGDISSGYKAAYGVCAGVMGTLYLSAIVYGEMKRRRDMSRMQMQSRELGNHESSPNGQDHYGKEGNGQ